MARPQSAARLLSRFATAAVAGFVLAILISSVMPLAFGDRSLVVRSGSMTPAIRTGDIVAVHPIAPTSARIGDIVTFDNHGRLTSHRARAIERRGADVVFTTQGDANTGQEHWKVRADGRIGLVRYRVPKLGFVVVKVQSAAGRFALIIVPALLLALSLLRRIWRAEPRARGLDEPAS
ncbi:MAG: signal peptidase [Solirubrobacteraceae bacterium]|nr:signal peptidase [Solirubrobacteraceae bacterium]